MGTAVNGDQQMSIRDRPLYGGVHHGIITAGYVVPFVITILSIIVLLVLIIIIMKQSQSVKGDKKTCCQSLTVFRARTVNLQRKAEIDVTLQANLIAVVLLCFLFTVYAFVLDMLSVSVEDVGTLPSYYVGKRHLFKITIVCSIFSILFDVVGMGVMLVSYFRNHDNCFVGITVGMVCCIGSTIMSLSFHFQDVLIAWTTTPFYASKIALFYGIAIFLLFISLKYAYILSNELTEVCYTKCTKIVIISITSIFVIGTISTVATFIVHFPTNNFIEESVTALTTTYNGAIILFGGLLAYKLGLFYFSSSFSINCALRKAIDQMNTPPSNPIQMNEWNELTDEGKLVKVMKAFIYKETFRSHHDDFFLEVTAAEHQAIANEDDAQLQARIINTLTPCVKRKLTTIVKNTLIQPQMPEALRTNCIAFIDPLVNALCEAVTTAAGTFPIQEGRITSFIKIDIFNLTVALTSALIPTLTAVVKENPEDIHPASPRKCIELREGVKNILVAALNCNPSSPTLNNNDLKEKIRSALIRVPHVRECDNGRGDGTGRGTGRGGCLCGIFSCCCKTEGHNECYSYRGLHEVLQDEADVSQKT